MLEAEGGSSCFSVWMWTSLCVCFTAQLLHSPVRLTGIPVSVLSSNAGGSYLGGKACWLAYGFHGEPVGHSDCMKQMLGKSGRKNEFLRQVKCNRNIPPNPMSFVESQISGRRRHELVSI